jgi:hypothetical protein
MVRYMDGWFQGALYGFREANAALNDNPYFHSAISNSRDKTWKRLINTRLSCVEYLPETREGTVSNSF